MKQYKTAFQYIVPRVNFYRKKNVAAFPFTCQFSPQIHRYLKKKTAAFERYDFRIDQAGNIFMEFDGTMDR